MCLFVQPILRDTAPSKSFLAAVTASSYQDFFMNWDIPIPPPKLDKVGQQQQRPPFSSFRLEEEYENEKNAEKDAEILSFNKALLANSFWRLEAMERRRDEDVLAPMAQKRARHGDKIIQPLANPLEPSIGSLQKAPAATLLLFGRSLVLMFAVRKLAVSANVWLLVVTTPQCVSTILERKEENPARS